MRAFLLLHGGEDAGLQGGLHALRYVAELPLEVLPQFAHDWAQHGAGGDRAGVGVVALHQGGVGAAEIQLLRCESVALAGVDGADAGDVGGVRKGRVWGIVLAWNVSESVKQRTK